MWKLSTFTMIVDVSNKNVTVNVNNNNNNNEFMCKKNGVYFLI